MARDSDLTTRPFVAGAAHFDVDCPTETLRDLVEAVLVDLINDHSVPDRRLRIVEGGHGQLDVQVGDDEDTHYVAYSPEEAMTALVTAITRVSLDSEPDMLHLHAAAVAQGTSGMLITAPSGSGKTTLAAALVLDGWSYTSDESVSIHPELGRCHGFAKPLIIKPSTPQPLPQLVNLAVQLESSDSNWWAVPASSIGARIETSIEPATIVVLRPSGIGFDEPPVITPLHPTEAVVAMMEQTMDAGRFGANAVHVLARLASQSRCISLQAGPIPETLAALQDLVASESSQPSCTELVALTDGVDGWRIAASVQSAQIDDLVVAHDVESGSIVSLDEAGSALWLALNGDPPPWWTPEIMRSESAQGFLATLAGSGLIDTPIAS